MEAALRGGFRLLRLAPLFWQPVYGHEWVRCAKKNVKKEEIINIIKSLLPGFEHIETGKSLDQKM